MKEYKFYSNKKIVIFAYISVLFFGISMSGTKLIFGAAIYMLAFLIFITANIRKVYTVDGKGITRKLFGLTSINWADVKEILISDWYIKITTNNGIYFKILRMKSYHDLFENIKQDIISFSDNNKIIYPEPTSEEGLKREGGLSALLSYFVLQSIFSPLGIAVQITSLLKVATTIDAIYLSLLILNQLLGMILSIYIWVLIVKREKKAVKIIKFSVLVTLALNFVARIINLFVQQDSFLLNNMIIPLSFLIYSILFPLIIIEYVNTSERVKHYFVKD